MPRVLIVVPHSHTWFWTQTCIAALLRFPVEAKIVVVDNSPWSPSRKGLVETSIRAINWEGWSNEGWQKPECKHEIVTNTKSNKFHASALDDAIERFGADYDYLMAWETDVLALAPDWLDWFLNQMRPTDYAVGHWHHEQFVNPSCTLYRMSVLREMLAWCRDNPEPDILRWGESWEQMQDIQKRQPERDYRDWYNDNVSWLVGPFADKRGWPAGTVLKEQPSGQLKGPGWMEPGQELHHWAVQAGYTYTVCPTWTHEREPGLPLQTVYGVTEGPARGMEADELMARGIEGDGWSIRDRKTVHLWGGTRALDILKHPVECNFVRSNTPFWLAREARFWRDIVPADVQAQTLELIRQHRWHTTSIDGRPVQERDREAAKFVEQCYLAGGVSI